MNTTSRTGKAVIGVILVTAAAALFHVMSVGSTRLQHLAGLAGTSVAAGAVFRQPPIAMSGMPHTVSRQVAHDDGSAPVLQASADGGGTDPSPVPHARR